MKIVISLWLLFCFLAIHLVSSKINDNSTCAENGDCLSCVGVFAESSKCAWCGSANSCISKSNKDALCADNSQESCSDSYYSIIIFVSFAFLCSCCCCACCMRQIRFNDEDGNETSFLHCRSITWRRGSYKAVESEWMCVMCGFDNKSRAEYCTLCGTSHQFTTEYKVHKLVQRKQKKLKKKQKLLEKSNKDSKAVVFAMEEGCSAAHIFPVALGGDKEENEDEKPIGIRIPIEAQVNESKSFAESAQFSSSLSSKDRETAFNFRRLNQLTLRQKSSRRRKMWRRELDKDTGGLKWVRATAKQTKVGDAPFGYTPRNSNDSSVESSILDAQSYGSEFSRAMYSALFNKSRSDSLDEASSSLLRGEAYANSPSKMTKYGRYSSPSPRGRDSFDNTLVSGSPGYTSVFGMEGELMWEEVGTGQRAESNCAASLPSNASYTPLLTAPAAKKTSYLMASPPPMDNPLVNDLQAAAMLPFKAKHMWFLSHVEKLQVPWNDGFIRLAVHRGNLLHDAFRCFNGLKRNDLHKWMRIQFINEIGVDAGGLEREFFGLVSQLILEPSVGLFTSSAASGTDGQAGAYHINPLSSKCLAGVNSAKNHNHIDYYRFIGRFLGKSIMEQQSVLFSLSLPLRKQILSLPITFSDLEFVDADLYKNLMWLLKNSVVGLELDFTVSYMYGSHSITMDLKPNGASIPVTDSNKNEYLQLRLRHRMLDSIKPQLEQFLRGFYEVIPPDLLSVFDYQELDLLICGVPDIDMIDWMQNTEYLGEYAMQGKNHRVVKWFWQTVEDYSIEERVRLLQFTTGCCRLPPQGFKYLQSNNGNYRRFNIQSIFKSDSIYPRAHTCFNKLDLPLYSSKAELEAHLSVVVHMETSGFSMD